MKRNILSPSMLSVDFGNMNRELKKVTGDGMADYIHVDVMDGEFVPNISFGPPVMKFVRKALPHTVLDVHLMIEEPNRYLDSFKENGADILTIHAEAVKHLHSSVMEIKNAGLKCGVAICPATPVSMLEYVIEEADMILVMSVNPGFGGQKFIPSALQKIREVKELASYKNADIDIEVDGGITLNNVDEVLNAGANVIVAGSAVFKGDSEENVREFMKHLR